MEEQVTSFFEEFSKKPKSGKRQYELVKKYLKIQSNPKALEDFVSSFESELVAPLQPMKM